MKWWMVEVGSGAATVIASSPPDGVWKRCFNIAKFSCCLLVLSRSHLVAVYCKNRTHIHWARLPLERGPWAKPGYHRYVLSNCFEFVGNCRPFPMWSKHMFHIHDLTASKSKSIRMHSVVVAVDERCLCEWLMTISAPAQQPYWMPKWRRVSDDDGNEEKSTVRIIGFLVFTPFTVFNSQSDFKVVCVSVRTSSQPPLPIHFNIESYRTNKGV